MTRQRHFFLILILGSLTALGPFSIDMYLPSFPAIAADLHTTVERVTLSLSSYFVGISAGQLIYGPLLDKYGRKKPLYAGLAVYLLASFGCMMVHTVDGLIAIRFLQAIGSCAAAVAAIAMVRDLFPVEENAKVFALLMLVVGASPMLAPAIGGYVTEAFGWHAIFLILALIAIVILLAVIFALPSSYQPNHQLSLKPGPMVASFWEVMRNPQFFTYVLAGSFSFAGLFTYVAGSPLVFMELYKVSKINYGWIFAGLSVGFIGASQVNSWLLKSFTSQQIVPVALTVQVIAGIVFVGVAATGWLGLAGVLIMLFILLSCIGLISPNTSALSLAPFAHNAGTASALMGALQLGVGALASTGVGFFQSLTAVPLASIMAGTAVVAALIYFTGRRLIKAPVLATEGAVVMH
ncbi:Bcr/CflA family multidrug efflux MFS transporter [Mucilaginibacter daejeonensis]|uniref:Bcr/CflA family multidrug efflux MFS transporter n=1 Tax=Mucilaginibacter daejeonensis TaxID=398049 RepID=UPI001D17B5D1|nr:Bcr/CflA family multidrug efflux MFS transporter [Mucilaginibacter daejeonensis]UEG53223.1 Bcr/CflA family multidrug efflux MFS transporter [Mucilaginibacter daejeonensis]